MKFSSLRVNLDVPGTYNDFFKVPDAIMNEGCHVRRVGGGEETVGMNANFNLFGVVRDEWRFYHRWK